MEATKSEVRQLFGGNDIYRIPPYQREYQWQPDRWQSLWHDIGSVYDDQISERCQLPKHFIGASIVEQQTAAPGHVTPYNVIDGQQRLVTLSVLLAAIRDAKAENSGEAVALNHGLYWVRDDDGRVLSKRLEVQEVDRDALDQAMQGGWREWYRLARHQKYLKKSMVLYAYTYFRFCIWNGVASFDEGQEPYTLPVVRAKNSELDAEGVWQAETGLLPGFATPIDLAVLDDVVRKRLFILNLTLEEGDEDGPTIFDTMNAKRTQLEQWDFIRNSLFIRLPSIERDELFTASWEPTQAALHQVSYAGQRAKSHNQFIYDYLIARGEIREQGPINRNRGHDQLMRRVNRLIGGQNPSTTIQNFVSSDLLPAAAAWCCAVGSKQGLRSGTLNLTMPTEALVARDSIMTMSAGPPIPVMLHYIDGWARGELNDAGLSETLRLLESYVARHVMCQTPMSPFRAHFMQVMPDLQSKYETNDLRQALQNDWKTDDEVRTALGERSLYESLKPAQLGAIFRGLELELGGPGANPLSFGKKDNEYSVEHIYPKSGSPNPNAAWAAEFRAWKVSSADQAWIVDNRHHLGNLTVITNTANRRLQAKSFAKKLQAYLGEDPENLIPPLAINNDIRAATQWTKAQIQVRSRLLTNAALQRWKLG